MTSRFPRRFEDDGTNVTLDVHGCSIADANYMIRRSVQEAFRRGRGRVMVIHGRSADSGSGRTIKTELERRLSGGELDAWISGSTQDAAGGRSTLWIKIGSPRNPRTINVRDVVAP